MSLKNKKMAIATALSLLLLLALVTVVIVIFMKPVFYPTVEKSMTRTDIEPIMNRFPRLEKVEKAVWQVDRIGESHFGPSSYRMKGYIFLSEQMIKQLENSYEWVEVSNWKPSIHLTLSQVNAHHWTYSEEFNDYVVPNNYIGKFYWDSNNKLFYFEVDND
ncbi:hypothetical protein K0T92_07390 [Paenibacillus oenotherae]|uniref:DUF5590 domain-containing protein n=1 Tax=Paenibacillus oenotherae TaxID=1435645 RepID=A0ABS7D3Q9_9BACL|nr:hypothetical protein [Paenibacillus oenotherae]MBW7474565.1 hypothetical protein [Paenibacillus oenotherae]